MEPDDRLWVVYSGEAAMKIPNAESAVVDIEKLTDYCLNADHPRGKHKARVFLAACGYSAENAELMRQQLLEAAVQGEAREIGPRVHGRRFVVECTLVGPIGRAAVRTAWIVREGEDFPRFVSAYVI
jgi:hypothetical protein